MFPLVLALGLVILVGALVVWRLLRWSPAPGSKPLEEWKHVPSALGWRRRVAGTPR